MLEKLKAFFLHEQTSKQEKLVSAVLAFGYVIGMGTRGQQAMQSEWYSALMKPAVQPPNWIFMVAWTLLFILIGLAAYYAWNFYKFDIGRKLFAGLYVLNGLLMAAWTDQFFVNHNLGKGLVILVGLIVVIEALIIVGFYTNKKSSYLLMPYLLWILFATYLNASYLTLN
ncbi:MAG: TspO/MBR family protein [Candidatus Peregrinibacteria bacterium]